MNVWVVLGEHGEYSEKVTFVGGVFATEQEARDAILRRMAVRLIHDQWNANRLGPEPEYEWAERMFICAVKMGHYAGPLLEVEVR